VVFAGLNRLTEPKKEYRHVVSIIIAARNEENRILPCLHSLENIDYPMDQYEIIFVDDNSEDKTADLIDSYVTKNSNWKLVRLDKKSKLLRGKKNALMHGIKQAKGDLIFTTDADCIIPAGWLKKTVNYFSPDISMVLGYSPILASPKILYRLLQFDNLFSAIAAAAPAKLGYPFASVGRNLAYRKDAYHDVGGFLALKKFRSGDDIHLTSKFRYNNGGKIDFCAEREAFIHTQIPDSLKEIFQQQIRKNSKTFQLSTASIVLMSVIFMYYLLLVCLPVLLPSWISTWFAFLLIKFFLEFLPLSKAAIIFDQKDLIPFLPIMQVIYPFIIIFFSVIGTFQFYQWKK
jgi:cellulose synthase/poly-beta-1,6-N-acetylglucosamine synthase-like glycosyltransferase